MALGEYRPPNQISNDEDKYWKFTKTQIVYGTVGLMIGIPIFLLANLSRLIIIKIIAVLIVMSIMVFGIAIGGLTIRNSKYLAGGGLRMDLYIFRKLKKKFSKKCHVLYTKNIDRDRIVFYTTKITAGETSGFLEDFKTIFSGEGD